MKNVLLVCILFFAHHAIGASVKFEASGFVTDVDSNQFSSISIEDSWSASITFYNLTDNLTPISPNGSEFHPESVDGDFQMAGISFETSRVLGNSLILAQPFVGIDEVYFQWGIDELFQVDGFTINSYEFRLSSGLSPASLSNMPADADIEYIASNFEYHPPNPSFLRLSVSGASDIEASISSFSMSIVPIPAAAWLFGSALLGLFGLRKR